MNTSKILFWATTGFVAFGMAASSIMYFTYNPAIVEGFEHIQFPRYMIVVLGVAKLLGAIGLLLPKQAKLNEWAYAGFTFMFVGAIFSHLATSSPFAPPLIALILLGVSYWSRAKTFPSQADQAAPIPAPSVASA
jgi:DoxX-like family